MANRLPTTFVDDKLNLISNLTRKYKETNNADNTKSFEDVTEYETVGSSYGADQINAQNTVINEHDDKIVKFSNNLTASDGLEFKFGMDGDGNYGYYGADGSLIPFSGGVSRFLIASHGTASSTSAQNYSFVDGSNAEFYSISSGTKQIGDRFSIKWVSAYVANLTFLIPGRYVVYNPIYDAEQEIMNVSAGDVISLTWTRRSGASMAIFW